MLTSPAAKRAFDLDLETDAAARPLRPQRVRRELPAGPAAGRGGRAAGDGRLDVHLPERRRGQRLGQPRRHRRRSAAVTGYEMLKANYCLPPLDRAYSALLEDLSERGLLDETLVVMLGEFGRTPKINPNAGRDHWGAASRPSWPAAASAAARSTAPPTSTPPSRRATPSRREVIATMYHALGLPPEATIHDYNQRPHPISDAAPLTMLF